MSKQESFVGHLIKFTSQDTGRETWILCNSNGPRKVEKIEARCFFRNRAEASYSLSQLVSLWDSPRKCFSLHIAEATISIAKA